MKTKAVAAVPFKKKKGYRSMYFKRNLELYGLCAIPLILVFVFKYLPMGGIVIAFKDYRFDKGIFGSDWVGFKNFEFFLKTTEFARITWNTLFMNFMFIITGTAAALLVALFLFQIQRRGAIKTYQTILIIPRFFSWVIVAYMLYAFLSVKNGVINNVIQAMGGQKIDWYSEPKYWPWILIIVNLWKAVGIDSVIYYAALMGLDSGMLEAGEIDGASRGQIMWHIILPSLMSIVVVMLILKIGSIFHADFGMFFQLTRDSGALYETTDVVDTYIFRALRQLGNMGMGSAVGLLQSFVGLILVLITNAASKKVDPDGGLF